MCMRWLAVVGLVLVSTSLQAQEAPKTKPAAAPAADRWEKEIAAMLAKDEKSPPPQEGIVFVGSSSMRLWDLAKSFPNLPVVNRGFGGSQIHDATKYATKIVTPLKPKPPDPDFDLGWSHRSGWYVVEVKSLTDQNEARQLRLGLGQVLDYHDALSRRHPTVRAVIAVERRPRDPRWVSLCERHDVLLVWPETFDAVLSRVLTDS